MSYYSYIQTAEEWNIEKSFVITEKDIEPNVEKVIIFSPLMPSFLPCRILDIGNAMSRNIALM